jgi:hypothetical protein
MESIERSLTTFDKALATLQSEVKDTDEAILMSLTQCARAMAFAVRLLPHGAQGRQRSRSRP